MTHKYNIGDRFTFKTGSHQGTIINYTHGAYTVEWSDIGCSSADDVFLDQNDYEYIPCEETIIDKILTKYQNEV